MSVIRANNETMALSWEGSRCCTRTKATPVLPGRCFSKSDIASKPPADAPMPTMGNVVLDDFFRVLAMYLFALSVSPTGNNQRWPPVYAERMKLSAICVKIIADGSAFASNAPLL